MTSARGTYGFVLRFSRLLCFVFLLLRRFCCTCAATERWLGWTDEPLSAGTDSNTGEVRARKNCGLRAWFRVLRGCVCVRPCVVVLKPLHSVRMTRKAVRKSGKRLPSSSSSSSSGESSAGESSGSDHQDEVDDAEFTPSGRLHLRGDIRLDDDPKYEGKRIPLSKWKEGKEDADGIATQDPELSLKLQKARDKVHGQQTYSSDESDSADGQGSSDEAPGDDIDEELKRIEMEDREALKRLSAVQSSDLKKAQGTKRQLMLWDDFLRVRISLHSMMTAANRLPPSDIFPSFAKQKVVKKPLNKCLHDVSSIVQDLVGLQGLLSGSNPDIPLDHKSTTASKGTPSPQELWSSVLAGTKATGGYCRDVLNRWDQKVRLHSGKKQSSLVAVNRSVVSQIDSVMMSKDRLLKRTQTTQQAGRILGKHVREDESSLFDEEIFDDSDFYQTQLREFVASGQFADLERRKLEQTMTTKLKKVKRQVDTKASKGRRLRFTKHEKLENFMAPVPLLPLEIDVDGLMGSLFEKNPLSHLQ